MTIVELFEEIEKLKAENKRLRDTLGNIDTLIDNINSDGVAITLTAIKYRIQQALQDRVLQQPDVQGEKK